MALTLGLPTLTAEKPGALCIMSPLFGDYPIGAAKFPLPQFNSDSIGAVKLPQFIIAGLTDGFLQLPSIFLTESGPTTLTILPSGGVVVGGDAVIVGDPLISKVMSGGARISGAAVVTVSSPTITEAVMLGGAKGSGSAAVGWNWNEMLPAGGAKLAGQAVVGGRSTYLLAADSGLSVATEAVGSNGTQAAAESFLSAVSSGGCSLTFLGVADSSAAANTGAVCYLLFAPSANSGIQANTPVQASAIYAIAADSVAVLMTGTQFVVDFTDGWAYNLNTGAASFYEGFKFNSFAMIDGEYYGANEQGIFRLGSDTDAGAEIDALITLGTSRFGSDFVKAVPAIYAGAKSNEPMQLTCRVEGKEYSYMFSRETEVVAPTRVVPGKGLKGVYWQIELANTNGADIDLDSLSIVVAPMSKKVGNR